ncbi:MAG: GH3 auxin-responsive promoter family protein [Planctomycetota bacterium]
MAETQAALLRSTLRANVDTDFGRRHGFDRIGTVADYQRAVPVRGYDELRPWIDRIADGERGVLTSEPVRLLEPTSGTSGGEKLVPYTASLQRQYRRGVDVWIEDLLRHRPGLRRGRAYWSLSPALGPRRRSRGGLPIGFDDDAAYLGGPARALVRQLMVAPPSVAGLPDAESFRRRTLLHLLAARDLALVSVWSPTFLTTLLAPLADSLDDVLRDLVDRRTPVTISEHRVRELRGLLEGHHPLPEKLARVWPRLGLVSCWTDASAALFIGPLRALLPHVELQGKGLLATEGCVSVPLVERLAPALCLRSHVFEFLDGDGRPHLAHELEAGQRYEVVLTTAGGLYRYRLHDEIQVVDFDDRCPMLRFTGRSDQVSDLVGEKLAEPHVRAILERACADLDVAPAFTLLAPCLRPPVRYHLYLQWPRGTRGGSERARTLGRAVQASLAENPHYALATRLGQLAPLEILLLDAEGPTGWSLYEQAHTEQGRKLGDVKPAALDHGTDWPRRFARYAHAVH